MTNNRLNIGIFTCHIDNDYTNEVCKGAEIAAKELDCNLIVFPGMFLNASFYDPVNQLYDYQYNSIFYYANAECLDALIVSVGAISSFLSEKNIMDFLSHFDNIPIITIEEKLPGYPCIKTDNTSGMHEAMEHLIIHHNCKRICFMAGKTNNADSNQRLNIYRDALSAHGIEYEERRIGHGDFSEYCRDEIGQLIDSNPDMDAIVFANDQMAIGGYSELKSRGIRVGETLPVIGFDDSPSAVNMDPPLTTVNINSCDLGYRAVYGAVRLAQTGSIKSQTLSSHFVRRMSCCCKLPTEKSLITGDSPLLDHSVDDILSILDQQLFGEISDSFFATRVTTEFNGIFGKILSVIKSPDDVEFSQCSIVDKIKILMDSDLMDFYSVQKTAYVFRELASIISSCPMSAEKRLQFNRLNANITNTISLFISNKLYSQMRSNKMMDWSSIYITRDTLTYGNDLNKTYMSTLNKLQSLNYNGVYLYTYDDDIRITDTGSWIVPNSLFLQAFYNSNNCQVLFGESRRIPSSEIFDNEYTYYDKRFTSVIVPIFTNEDHHGVFICNTDVSNFNSIYSTSLQLGAALKYMTLLKEQNITQEQLKMSLNEIHEKNELLNQLSTLDELTGIYNRRGFMEKVEYYINMPSNRGMKAFLLFADMDSLKVVNDKFGHKDGDYALKNIASILSQSFGPHDVIGRIGGDEFVCFAFIDSSDYINQVQARIKELSADLNATCGKPYFIEMSVGVTEFICNGNQKIEDLLSQADTALYSNKRYKRISILK
ncbi:MAG: GGDEF domain-containing protein [Clostridiales bacterium]|nr:GGDEF domain-containing protein [Clostridiales bacterium]